jgi:hypothetical protein
VGRRRAAGAGAILVALVLVVGARLHLDHTRDRLGRTDRAVAEAVASRHVEAAARVAGRDLTAAASVRLVEATAARDATKAQEAKAAADLQRAQGDESATRLVAWYSGARQANTADCLAGLARSLNQLHIGDGNATSTMRAVSAPCRATTG